jgi:hypothetical protein
MNKPKTPPTGSRRMPENSTFYDRLVPILIIGLGIVTLVLMLVAAGVLFGLIAWH